MAPESSYIMVFLMDLTDLCLQDIHASPSIITELTTEWTEFEWNRNKIKIKWNKLFLKNGIYRGGTVGCFVSSSYCTVTVDSKFDGGGAAYPPDATAPTLVSSLVSSCLRLKYFQFMFPPLLTFTVYGTVLDEKITITETLMGVSSSSFFQQLRGLCSWFYWFSAMEERKKWIKLYWWNLIIWNTLNLCSSQDLLLFSSWNPWWVKVEWI